MVLRTVFTMMVWDYFVYVDVTEVVSKWIITEIDPVFRSYGPLLALTISFSAVMVPF